MRKLLLALVLLPATLPAQARDATIQTPRGECEVWVSIPGGTTFERDKTYNRCALDDGLELVSPDWRPPTPRIGRAAHGDYTVVVDPDGTVNAELTRAWTLSQDMDFHRRLRETFRSWRFEPGVRGGVPVRSGFRLAVETGVREDTLPARLEWRWVRGFQEDTLRGEWVHGPPPPAYDPDTAYAIYESMLDRLLEMRVVLERSRVPYCALHEPGDSAMTDRLTRLLRDGVYRRARWAWYWPLPDGCATSPGYLRIVFPRIHRTEDGRAVLYAAGDHLEEWPPGLDGRTYRGWTARCIADVDDGEVVETTCEVGPIPSPGPHAFGDPPPILPEPTSADEPVRVAVVATMVGAYRRDTLFASIPEVPRLEDRAVFDFEAPRCERGMAWVAYTGQARGELLLVHSTDGEDLASLRMAVTDVHMSQPTRHFSGRRCAPRDRRSYPLVAFFLGDVGDPPTAPVTLCLLDRGCPNRFVVDGRHVLADSASLRFRVGDLPPSEEWTQQLAFRIHLDRDASIYPLVLLRTDDRWRARIPRKLDARTWDYRVGYAEGYPPGTEVRVYFFEGGE